MTSRIHCDVLVVGAGPVGATLALLLGQQGLKVVATDRAADIHPLPRAAHIDHEIVRVFQQLGVADAVMETSKVAGRYDFLTASGEVLLRFESEAGSPSGWPGSNMIHQPSVEACLRQRITEMDNVSLLPAWDLVGYQADSAGVTASFETPTGVQTVAATYLVGCDGARSTVRDLAGIDLEDLDFDEPWLVIDTVVLDATRLPALNLQICDPARPTTCVQMGAGRHRWEFMLLPGETTEQVMEDAFITDLLAPWKVEGAVELERKAVYRFHALIARQWRQGRVFLAGDAAHQTPPFAGQGLCAGVRDAANLAWKLAAVLRGEASDTLLDTYQAERAPHVRFVIDLALMMGRTVCILDPVAAAARNAGMLAQRAAGAGPGGAFSFPPFQAGCILAGAPGAGELFPQPWLAIGQGLVRLDDRLEGHGPWLLLPSGTITAVAEGPADDQLAPFAPSLEPWFTHRQADAVLIRPDRYVFGTGQVDTLRDAWAAATN